MVAPYENRSERKSKPSQTDLNVLEERQKDEQKCESLNQLHRSGRDEVLDKALRKGGVTDLDGQTGLLVGNNLLDVGAVDDAVEVRDEHRTVLTGSPSAVNVGHVTHREDEVEDVARNLGGDGLLELLSETGESLATDEILADDKGHEEGLPVLGKLVKVNAIETGLDGNLLDHPTHDGKIGNDNILDQVPDELRDVACDRIGAAGKLEDSAHFYFTK